MRVARGVKDREKPWKLGRDVGSRWMAGGCGKAGDVRKIERIQITGCVEEGGGMTRETGGDVGERRGWLCSKSNGGRRGRSEGLGRVTGRTRESPEREWNQYVKASVCPWPHMRVFVSGEAKHASIYGGMG